MVLAVTVGLAGAIGAVARYLLDGAVQDRSSGLFPYGTLTVNVIGSFVLGVLAGLSVRHTGSGRLNTVLGAGFCGGLTTWSTASWETVRLVQEGAKTTAARYALANLAASFAAAGTGLIVVLR